METIWNPIEEHLEGKLCEKGLMEERFDLEKNDLIRKLTLKGKLKSEELLKDPFWIKAYLKIAYSEFSKFPLDTRKILWKKIANQLRNIRKKDKDQKSNSNAYSAKEL